jgi:hypothetical protein
MWSEASKEMNMLNLRAIQIRSDHPRWKWASIPDLFMAASSLEKRPESFLKRHASGEDRSGPPRRPVRIV